MATAMTKTTSPTELVALIEQGNLEVAVNKIWRQRENRLDLVEQIEMTSTSFLLTDEGQTVRCSGHQLGAILRRKLIERDDDNSLLLWHLSAMTIAETNRRRDWEVVVSKETGEAHANWSEYISEVRPGGMDLAHASLALSWGRDIYPALEEIEEGLGGQLIRHLRYKSVLEELIPLFNKILNITNETSRNTLLEWLLVIISQKTKPTVPWVRELKQNYVLNNGNEVIEFFNAASVNVQQIMEEATPEQLNHIAKHALRSDLRSAPAEEVRKFIDDAVSLSPDELEIQLEGPNPERSIDFSTQVAFQVTPGEHGRYSVTSLVELGEPELNKLRKAGFALYDEKLNQL